MRSHVNCVSLLYITVLEKFLILKDDSIFSYRETSTNGRESATRSPLCLSAYEPQLLLRRTWLLINGALNVAHTTCTDIVACERKISQKSYTFTQKFPVNQTEEIRSICFNVESRHIDYEKLNSFLIKTNASNTQQNISKSLFFK